MGTMLEVNIPIDKKTVTELEKVYNIIESEVSRLDNMLSIFDASSIVSKINNDNEKRIVNVPLELFQLMMRAKEYFILTDGAFDITVEPLTDIWGFGPTRKTTPITESASNILDHVGFDKIDLDEKRQSLIFKDPKIKIDFGGLAKGYAVDHAVRILKRHNIAKALVSIGGDLYCLGTNSDGKDWSIGIRNPKNKNKIIARLKVRNKAIATSGSYENFFIYQDKRYNHIIDPHSGCTVANNLMSVTIIADDCTTTDALATAVFVLGEDKGLALVEKLIDIECFLVIDRNDNIDIRMSSGMRRYISKIAQIR
jgi:thiamine biosynthesis lipoprotein